MTDLFFTEMHFWLLFTAILFTYVGKFMARTSVLDHTGKIIEATIDRLIADGYVKTKKVDGEVELLRYNEEQWL